MYSLEYITHLAETTGETWRDNYDCVYDHWIDWLDLGCDWMELGMMIQELLSMAENLWERLGAIGDIQDHYDRYDYYIDSDCDLFDY